jgi:hypothetical protein
MMRDLVAVALGVQAPDGNMRADRGVSVHEHETALAPASESVAWERGEKRESGAGS